MESRKLFNTVSTSTSVICQVLKIFAYEKKCRDSHSISGERATIQQDQAEVGIGETRSEQHIQPQLNSSLTEPQLV